MWRFHNPVQVCFGVGSFDTLAPIIGERAYALVTYDEPYFHELTDRLEERAGPAVTVIDNIQPNPDFVGLRESCARLARCHAAVDVIVAVGGGSVIDAAKALAFGPTGFDAVQHFLEHPGESRADTAALPLIAVPTTAGTGSEMTSWATIWDAGSSKKYSLARGDLYPTHAVIDPALMIAMPRTLTISTALDALSHALESIWNVNANPVSTRFAVAAARDVLEHLPPLAQDLDNLDLREHMARAAMMAGIAFSNTKTALAHSLSYPVTLHHGIAHGIACSFTLPRVLRSVIGADPSCDRALVAIFGDDLEAGADRLADLLGALDVSVDYADYGVSREQWDDWVAGALGGERGRNFIGSAERVGREFLDS